MMMSVHDCVWPGRSSRSHGSLIHASDPDSTYAMTYDELNRMTSIDNLGTPNVPRFTLTYSHDAVGNVLSVFDNYGVTVSSTYDERNLLATRDWTGPGLDHVRIENFFNELGQEIQSDRSTNGVLSVRKESAYDNMNRLDTLTYKNALDEVLSSFDYNYNLKGLVSRLTYESQAITGQQTSDYLYDPTAQLTDALYNGWAPDEHFAWDLNGNPTGPGVVIGPGNRLLEKDGFRYEFDNEGNTIRKTELSTGNYWIYEWDFRNRLVRVTEYSYGGVILHETIQVHDVFNRRIANVADGDRTSFIQDGHHTWADVDDEGTVVARYLYSDIIDEILARQSVDGVTFYLTDRLGTVRDLANGAGSVVNHFDFTAFGTIVLQTNPLAGDRFTFQAREFDLFTGLYQMRTRFYDPNAMRFISQDWSALSAGDTNVYRYVSNSPPNFADPSGRGPIWDNIVFYSRVLFNRALTSFVHCFIYAGAATLLLFLPAEIIGAPFKVPAGLPTVTVFTLFFVPCFISGMIGPLPGNN